MQKKIDIETVIIQSKRMDIREAFRDCLKRYNISDIHPCNTAEQAIDLIATKEKALLVIDWDMGFEAIIKTLEAARKKHKIFTRPIILVTKAASPEVLGTAYEYHITKVYTGDISINRIREIIEKVVEDDKMNAPLRSIFAKVAQSRDTGDYETADQLLDGLYKKFPTNPKIIAELAENKILMNRWSEAQALVEPLLNVDPPYVRALHILGRCRMKKKDFKGAIDAFGKAKTMNPYNFERLLSLGDAMLATNDAAGAKQNFKEAQKIDPNSKAAKKGEGTALLLEGDVNEALEVLRDVTNNSSLASIFNSSAILAIKNGDLKAGLNLYDAAVKSIPQDGLIHSKLYFNKGIGYQRFKQPKEALECFEKATKLDGKNEKAVRNYNDLFKKLGAPGAAPQGLAPAAAAQAPATAQAPAAKPAASEAESDPFALMDEQFDKEFIDDSDFDSANLDDTSNVDDDDEDDDTL